MSVREDIYSIALSCFNMDYARIKNSVPKEDKNSDGSIKPDKLPVEINYCKNFLDAAISFCAQAQPWYFLIEEEIFNEDDLVEGESFRGLNYGYYLPDDFCYPVYVNGAYDSTYAIRQDMIFFPNNRENVLHYVTNTLFVDAERFNYPILYKYLIAYRLAMEIAPFLTPDSAVQQKIAQAFQLSYQALIQSNNDSFRTKNPPQDFFVV